jgi:hypothetical protein
VAIPKAAILTASAKPVTLPVVTAPVIPLAIPATAAVMAAVTAPATAAAAAMAEVAATAVVATAAAAVEPPHCESSIRSHAYTYRSGDGSQATTIASQHALRHCGVNDPADR